MSASAKTKSRKNQGGLSGWHPEDVKAAVRKRGHTLTSLSLAHHFSPAYLRAALRRPLYEGEQIIARFLGIAPYAIWPERYHRDGTSKIQRGASAPIRRAA